MTPDTNTYKLKCAKNWGDLYQFANLPWFNQTWVDSTVSSFDTVINLDMNMNNKQFYAVIPNIFYSYTDIVQFVVFYYTTAEWENMYVNIYPKYQDTTNWYNFEIYFPNASGYRTIYINTTDGSVSNYGSYNSGTTGTYNILDSTEVVNPWTMFFPESFFYTNSKNFQLTNANINYYSYSTGQYARNLIVDTPIAETYYDKNTYDTTRLLFTYPTHFQVPIPTIAESLIDLNIVKTEIDNAIVSKGGTSNTDMHTYAQSIIDIQTGLPTQELNITPIVEDQTFESTEVAFTPVNVSAVSNTVDGEIIPSNIRLGVNILGVTGTYNGPTGPTGEWNSIQGTYTGNRPQRYKGGFEWRVLSQGADYSMVQFRMWVTNAQPAYGMWNSYDNTSYYNVGGTVHNFTSRIDTRNCVANQKAYMYITSEAEGLHTYNGGQSTVFPYGATYVEKIYHNPDGTKQVAVTTYLYGGVDSLQNITTSATITLPTIGAAEPSILNVMYSDTQPGDTSKLWVKTTTQPSKVYVQTSYIGTLLEESIKLCGTTYSLSPPDQQWSAMLTYYNGAYKEIFGYYSDAKVTNIDLTTGNSSNVVDITGSFHPDGWYGVAFTYYNSKWAVSMGGSYGRLNIIDLSTNTGRVSNYGFYTFSQGFAVIGDYIYIPDGYVTKVNCNDGSYATDYDTFLSQSNYGMDSGVSTDGTDLYFMTGVNTMNYNPPTNDSIHKFNVGTNTWTTINASISNTGTLGYKRMIYRNNKLWIFCYSTRRMFDYDLTTNTLTEHAYMLNFPNTAPSGFVDYDGTIKFSVYNNSTQDHEIWQFNPDTPYLGTGKIIINNYGQNNKFDLITKTEVDVQVPIKEVLQGDSNNVGKYVNTYIYKDGSWTEINGRS